MRIFGIFLAAALIAAPSLGSARETWTSVGPEGGAITVMAMDPTNPETVYVGTAGGKVMKSPDAGRSWQAVGRLDALIEQMGIAVTGLVINPQDPNVMYAAAGTSVFASKDAGAVWGRRSSGIGGSQITSLVIDPEDPLILYAGTYAGGIFKTKDGGNRWDASNSGIGASDITCLAINPQKPRTLYAGSRGPGAQLYKTTGGGATWVDGGIRKAILSVAIDRLNPSIVYAVARTGANLTVLYKSTNNGDAWTDITSGLHHPGSVAIDPQNSSIIYAGGYEPSDRAVRSTDGGATWTVTGISGVHFKFFYANPAKTSVVYALSDRKGIYKSASGGISWDASNTGLSVMAITALAVDRRSPATLYAAGQSAILTSTSGGRSWVDVSLNDGFSMGSAFLTIHPVSQSTVYAGIDSFYRTTNGGVAWARLHTGYSMLSPVIDPELSVIYAGSSDAGVLKSPDDGISWSTMTNGLPNAGVLSLAINPGNPQVLYAGTDGGGMFRSRDSALTWNAMNTGGAGSALRARQIVIDPSRTDILYAATSNGVLKSTDAGDSWIVASDGIVGEATALAINPFDPNRLYAGTFNQGVFVSTDGGVNWTAMNSGISHDNITALAIDPGRRMVYAGTSSRGIWATPLDDPADFKVNSGGAVTMLTSGTGVLRSGYAEISVKSGVAPFGTAVFSLRQNGVIVSEAGVSASPPTAAARIFIEHREEVHAIPARDDSGTVDVNTGLSVVNYGPDLAHITYTLKDAFGHELATGSGILRAGHHVACFIDQLRDCGVADFDLPHDFWSDIEFGSLDIVADQPLSVTALRGTMNQRHEFLLTTTPIADLMQAPGSSPIYFPQFVDGAGYTTSLILLNTSDVKETGTLQIRDKDGNPLKVTTVEGLSDSTFSYSIGPGGFFRLQTDGSAKELKAGWVSLTPDRDVPTPVGSGVFGFNPDDVLFSESGIPSVISTNRARVYVDLSEHRDTGLAIANVTNAASSISVTAYRTDGIPTAGTSQVETLLNGYGYAAGFSGSFVKGLPAGFTGVLDIQSNIPFAVLTLRSLYNERGDFLMATFPVADSNRPAPAPVVFPQITDGGGYVTEFVLVSPGGESTADLATFDRFGLVPE